MNKHSVPYLLTIYGLINPNFDNGVFRFQETVKNLGINLNYIESTRYPETSFTNKIHSGMLSFRDTWLWISYYFYMEKTIENAKANISKAKHFQIIYYSWKKYHSSLFSQKKTKGNLKSYVIFEYHVILEKVSECLIISPKYI